MDTPLDPRDIPPRFFWISMLVAGMNTVVMVLIAAGGFWYSSVVSATRQADTIAAVSSTVTKETNGLHSEVATVQGRLQGMVDTQNSDRATVLARLATMETDIGWIKRSIDEINRSIHRDREGYHGADIPR